MLKRQIYPYILHHICSAILLQLSCLRKMLTYAIFSKCSVTVLLPQHRFIRIRASTSRKIFFLQNIRGTNLKSGYKKALQAFAHKADKNIYFIKSSFQSFFGKPINSIFTWGYFSNNNSIVSTNSYQCLSFGNKCFRHSSVA